MINFIYKFRIIYLRERMNIEFHGEQTLENFWLEFFGLIGRELGTNKRPRRRFTDNPTDVLSFIEECKNTHEEEDLCRPAWMTVFIFEAYGKPMGMDKLFFDFDDDSRYCPQCDKWYKKNDLIHLSRIPKKKGTFCTKHGCEVIVKPRKKIIGMEVRRFLNNVGGDIQPLIVETYKGYHVYLFLHKIYTFSEGNYEFVRNVYYELKKQFFGKEKYQFLDTSSDYDIMRFCRIPLTNHEKTGTPCLIVKRTTLEPDKIRNISYFQQFGIPSSSVEQAIRCVKDEIKRKVLEETKAVIERAEEASADMQTTNGFKGRIRPCFMKRLESGEMTHSMRLAFLIEAYFSGCRTEDEIVDLFRNMGDFNESITRYQVKYFLDKSPSVYPPYRCKTLAHKGWCLGKSCSSFEKLIGEK